VRPEIARLVVAANARRASGAARTVALDLPSGLDADTGRPADPTIAADVTVTFAARKKGFEAREALPFLGQVVVASIGAPDGILERIIGVRRRG
jgi:NAD(P)H-hydrate epimerase